MPMPPDLRSARTMLTQKFASWAYEKEIRIFPSIHEREAGIPYLDFSDNLRLVQVILGSRCNETPGGIARVLSGSADGVQIIRARASDKVFAMEPE